jgi:predicted nucleic acid-binding Zn ribbon protein
LARGWEEAVGPEVADHCEPIAWRGPILELGVSSPVWAQHLQLRRPEILAALERLLGDAAPTDLRFRVR